MRIARKLALLVVMALAAMALAATSASAQDVEIENESGGGGHCNPTCNFHVEGNGAITLHIGAHEEVISNCHDEFEGTIDEAGEGEITSYLNEDTLGCTRQNCNGVGEPAGESSWPFHIEETGDPEDELEHAVIRFCLDAKANPSGPGQHCEIEVDIDREIVESFHHYIFSASDDPCPEIQPGVNAEVDGLWETEWVEDDDHDEIEIMHLDN